ncbi:MAG: DUF1614 domain-containing protein [Nitrospirota bacterium]|nr:DUF1614 domain-containing protein [Nitrospirota bacterium]
MRVGCLPLILFLILLALLPLVFGQLFTTALMKLRLEPSTAILLVMGIILGSGINIPLKRIARKDALVEDPLAILGLNGRWPWFQRTRQETVIAVNVGGCLIPAGLALYEIAHLLFDNPQSLPWLAIAVAVNTAVCYRLAQPVSGIGIALPGLVPAAVAAMSALWLAPEQAPQAAFVAGVLGPLIGADLLHLRDIEALETGIASIGGAGTFDGIVLSGIVAAYLA